MHVPWRISITLLSHRVLFIVPRERAETALWWMLIQLVGRASRAEQRRMRMHINNRWLWAISCEWADWYTADCRIQQLMSEWDSINNVCPSTPCNYCIHYFIRRVYRNCNKLLAVARNSFRANYAFLSVPVVYLTNRLARLHSYSWIIRSYMSLYSEKCVGRSRLIAVKIIACETPLFLKLLQNAVGYTRLYLTW